MNSIVYILKWLQLIHIFRLAWLGKTYLGFLEIIIISAWYSCYHSLIR